MGLLNWLAKKVAARLPPPPPAEPRSLSLNDALDVLLVKSVQAQGEAAASRTAADTEFIKAMAEIRVRSAAEALGRRGGNERVRRMREKQRAEPTWCPVCPKTRDDSRCTRAMMKWHMSGHAGSRPPMQVRSGDGQQSRQATADSRAESDAAVSSATAATDRET